MSRTKRKVSHANWLRHPKTFGDIRDAEACRVDGIVKRPARGKRRLPSNYDDLPVAAFKEIIQKYF